MKLDLWLTPGREFHSTLHALKTPPGRPSPASLKKLAWKLEKLKESGALSIDLSWLNNNFQRSQARYVRRCTASRLRELREERRYTALICFSHQLYRDTLDALTGSFEKLIGLVWKRAKNELSEQFIKDRKQRQSSLTNYQLILELVLNQEIDDSDLREAIFKKLEREDLLQEAENVTAWLTGKYSHSFQLVISRHSYIRQFAPTFLQHTPFQEDSESFNPSGKTAQLLDALTLLKEMNESGTRKLAENAPLGFVPKSLMSFIQGEELNKQAWECALLTALRDELRAGNLSVKESKRYAKLDDFLLPEELWKQQREAFFTRAGLPSEPTAAATYLTDRLGQAFERFLNDLPENSFVQIRGEEWQLSTDPAENMAPETEVKLERLKKELSKKLRQIKLPELLIEVDNQLRFTSHFMSESQQKSPRPEQICELLTTILAHGCNIGLETMSQLVEGASYHRLKQLSDWMLTEEAQRSALACVVNGINQLELAQAWGRGTTSSSDGQRFALRSKVLQQTYSHQFNDFAIEFYSWIADNYAPFYSIPIECTERDAPYVLDGLLYNESELFLEEHYTDTHGYTEHNFAAFAMLGRRFAPRIRGIKKQRLYHINAQRDYGALSGMVARKDRKIQMDVIIEQWERIGHFYASLESGHTTASIAMKRLNGYSDKNRFCRANRELGRIFKTEYLLQFLSDKELRGRNRRGLLKGEQLHALARNLNYGKLGQITTREPFEQRLSCSCSTLILAAIVYWQASELARILPECGVEETEPSLVRHISPISWNNVILYGEYRLDPKLVRL